MDSPTVTLEPGEVSAMLALGKCSEVLMEAKKMRKLLGTLESIPSGETVKEKPELSQEQVISFATEVLTSAPEDKRDSDVYRATMSLLTTALKHTGGDCELTPEEHRAYVAIKRMYYAGGFNRE